MKFAAASAALGMLAASAAASSQARHLHFPRANGTDSISASGVPLTTGGTASPSTIVTTSDVVSDKTLTMTLGTGTETSVVTTTIRTTVKQTMTVVASGSGSGEGDSGDDATATVTRTAVSTVTLTVYPGPNTPGNGNGNGNGGNGNGNGGNDGNDGNDCAPVTVTVTEPASTVVSTVFVTGADGPQSTTTMDSTVTVVPFPSGNSTRISGVASSSGFARLRR